MFVTSEDDLSVLSFITIFRRQCVASEDEESCFGTVEELWHIIESPYDQSASLYSMQSQSNVFK